MTPKSHELHIRRMADRQGFRLMRSKVRDQHALTFGKYQLVSLEDDRVVFGSGNLDRGFAATLDEVERWLALGPQGRAGRLDQRRRANG